jgi:methylenetetrahydrofolate reductase (NADPH)
MSAYPSTILRHLLDGARYEVLPTPSIGDLVRTHVPRSLTVTVTTSPTKGLGATLDLATALAADGYDVVPHVAARMVSGPSELGEIVARLAAAGITKVFVPAGDADPPAGSYEGALGLLEDLNALPHPFTQIGITGYPESHPSIDDDVTIQSMWDKRHYATHVISNMTFDAELIGTWAERLRRRGVALPLIVGVPGPVERTKLLGMATKIGVGESLRFLNKQKGVLARIASPGFSTDRFVQRVAALKDNDRLGIAGLHVFTFNQVEVVETWRQRMLAETAP